MSASGNKMNLRHLIASENKNVLNTRIHTGNDADLSKGLKNLLKELPVA